MTLDPNYFTCTLGQAAFIRDSSESKIKYSTIPDLLQQKSTSCSNRSSVGFLLPDSGLTSASNSDAQPEYRAKVFTFGELYSGVRSISSHLQKSVRHKDVKGSPTGNGGSLEAKRPTIALICPSSAGFLFTWLGLIELGYAVLLIAPQCQPGAIAHLCKTCDVETLFYDVIYQEQAKEASLIARNDDGYSLYAIELPFTTDASVFRLIESGERNEKTVKNFSVSRNSVAYIHHTSGTSSGLPKPIPQTHHAAIGVLPHLPSNKGTFTTTPLYHGGIADAFRAWTSDAPIWLFPGRDLSITASTVARCVRAAEKYNAEIDSSSQVSYFSSVPYVLQLLEGDEKTISLLQRMELVGVGGAALPVEIGDRLVEKGVRLLTRFGSAECGFLLSSHRLYEEDIDWQYHRVPTEVKDLMFEGRDGNLHELVVKNSWPHMAKRNREDGSYATSDLFEPHVHIPNAWRYHSRADSQLTLLTGKKFDPAPLEDAITTSPLIGGALIFGNGRSYPGVLLFRSLAAKDLRDEGFSNECQSLMQRINAKSQSHAKIGYDMISPMPYEPEALAKSSKGTILRSSAEQKYRTFIDKAYDRKEDGFIDVKDEHLEAHILGLARTTLDATGIGLNDELFHAGLDSMTSTRIRNSIAKVRLGKYDTFDTTTYALKLFHKDQRDLPLTLVEDCGTVKELINFVVNRRHQTDYLASQDDTELMRTLVDKYSKFKNVEVSGMSNRRNEEFTNDTYILTGATGALGSHVLEKLRHDNKVTRVYCLVRGATQEAAEGRLSKTLEQKGYSPLSLNTEDRKVVVLQSSLGQPQLGLEDKTYERLLLEVTVIVHLAWAVNFRMKLRNYEKDHITGLHNLILLALQSGRQQTPAFIYCSSVASVINGDFPNGIPESPIDEPSAVSPIGYSKSKWVAEQICNKAYHETKLRGRIAVLRVGQLSGDSRRGIWNTQEAWPMMLSSVKVSKSLPLLENEPLSWLPVDIAAEAFLEAAGVICNSTDKGMMAEMPIHHIINENNNPKWVDLLRWLKKKEDFEVVPVQEWLKKLEDLESKNVDHPSLKLLGHWKATYGDKKFDEEGTNAKGPVFSMEKTKKSLPSLRNVKEVDEGYFMKIWDYVKKF